MAKQSKIILFMICALALFLAAGCQTSTTNDTADTTLGSAEQANTYASDTDQIQASATNTNNNTNGDNQVTNDNTAQTNNRHAIIETNMGTMKIELFEQRAPLTTKNFIDLAQKGFYDGLIFHRVIEDFMIQGGDPTGTGMGDPGYKIKDEFHPELKHNSKGILSMANAGPNTGGSQFFITHAATPWLDGKHAVFGRLVDGEDVLDAIASTPTGAQDRPKQQVTMTKVTIE